MGFGISNIIWSLLAVLNRAVIPPCVYRIHPLLNTLVQRTEYDIHADHPFEGICKRRGCDRTER